MTIWYLTVTRYWMCASRWSMTNWAAEDLVVELYLAPCGWVGEDFAFGRIQERGKVFIMKLREGNGQRSSFGYLLSCAQIRSSAVGVRVCPKEATLRDMSPGYMVWY